MLDPDDDMILPAGVLSDRLNVYPKKFYREVKALGIESKTTIYNGREMPCYPIGTLTILRAIFEQREAEKLLPEYMSIGEIADALGKSYGWTDAAIKRHGFRAGKFEQRHAFRTRLYNKRVYRTLRDEVKQHPVAETGYNLTQLVIITGFDREWIENRLEEAGVQIELRQSPLTGKVLEFYDESVVDLLRGIPSYQDAGDWLTAEAIIKILGKSVNWTMVRLRLPRFAGQAEYRLDSQRVPRMHYPPQALAELQAEVDAAEQYREAGDWILVYEIAKRAGRSKLWVQNRLKLLPDLGEPRRDGKNRVKVHYPPEIVERLLTETPDDLRGN